MPDLVAFRPEYRIPAGVNGHAELVIEIRSPGDDSLLKLPYYSRVGVRELVIVERDAKTVRRWAAGVDGLVEVPPADDGWHRLTALAVGLRGIVGRLEVDTGAELVVI